MHSASGSWCVFASTTRNHTLGCGRVPPERASAWPPHCYASSIQLGLHIGSINVSANVGDCWVTILIAIPSR
jgi:hypothetical protein